MTTFDGKAILRVEGEARGVQVTLDLDARSLIVRHARNEKDDEESVIRALMGDTPAVAHLSDVEIQTPNGLLRTARIDNLHVRQRNPGSGGVDDSLLTRSLSLSTSNTGVATYTLVPANSIIEFEHQPTTCSDNEIVYAGGLSALGRHRFEVGGDEFHVNGDRKQLCVRSTAPLWNRERRIRLAATLLLGVRVAPLAAFEGGLLRINLAREATYKESHQLYVDHALAGGLFEHLLRFFLGLSEPDFWHWYKACAFLLEGKAGHTELDIGLVNLFVFLEMRDKSDTLSANTIAPLLDISLTDAKLVCRIRNRLIHESQTLNEAVQEANAELVRNEPTYSLKWFDLGGSRHSPGVMVAFRLYERLNHYLCRTVGWQKGYNAYENVLGPA
jgi:hypothetical protein